MNKVEFALHYAKYRHGDQKWSDKPYSYHLEQVLTRVAATGCQDEDVLCAAILHDIQEDTEAGYTNEVEWLFGSTVDQLTLRVTSKLKHGGLKRKESTGTVDWEFTLDCIVIDPADKISRHAALIKLCDRHHNSSEGKNGKCFNKYKKQYPLMKKKLQPILPNDNEEINRMWKELDELYL